MPSSKRLLDLSPRRGEGTKARLHDDGSICPEGTARLPRAFRPCCKSFAAHTLACDVDIRYEWWSKRKTWVVKLPSPGSREGVTIAFCPHCGRRLP